jgi:stringent starvation protein B
MQKSDKLRNLINKIENMDSNPYIFIDPMLVEDNREINIPACTLTDSELCILNVSSKSTKHRMIDNNTGYISCFANFEGKGLHVYIPIESITSIYSDCGEFEHSFIEKCKSKFIIDSNSKNETKLQVIQSNDIKTTRKLKPSLKLV